jgi:hypothetical protein
MPKQYVVIWRRGGTENFQWMRSESYQTRAMADLMRDSISKMGYACHVQDYHLSLTIGLPETYEP